MSDVPIDRLLASVRSVVAGIPAPRPPADEREREGWLRCGRFEIRLHDTRPVLALADQIERGAFDLDDERRGFIASAVRAVGGGRR